MGGHHHVQEPEADLDHMSIHVIYCHIVKSCTYKLLQLFTRLAYQILRSGWTPWNFSPTKATGLNFGCDFYPDKSFCCKNPTLGWLKQLGHLVNMCKPYTSIHHFYNMNFTCNLVAFWWCHGARLHGKWSCKSGTAAWCHIPRTPQRRSFFLGGGPRKNISIAYDSTYQRH